MEHNHKKNKKHKEVESENKQVEAPNPGTILSSEADLSKSGIRRPFKIGPNYPKHVSLPFKDQIAFRWNQTDFIKALKDNDTISKLQFNGYLWKQDEINVLEEALSANKGITEIEFFTLTLSPIFAEALVRILKKNTHIKTVIFRSAVLPVQPWTRFCDGLEYYHFETFHLSYNNLDQQRMEILKEYMLFNTSIKTLIIDGERMEGRLYNTFCSMLAKQPFIEKLAWTNCLYNQADFEAFATVLNANTLKSWLMKVVPYQSYTNATIREALAKNTSLTELAIQNCTFTTAIDISRLLERNRGIKKLDLTNDTNLFGLDLADNTTLTDLAVCQCYNLPISSVVNALSNNTTLKILRFGTNDMDDAPLLEQFLMTCHLEEIHLDLIHTHHVRMFASILENVLKVNKSIRKLSMPMHSLEFSSWKQLIESLRENTSLTWLNMGPIDLLGKIARPSNIEVEDVLVNVAKTNKTLQYVEGANHLTPLKQNRMAHEKIVSDTRWLIGLILKKPNSFVLPIEVWLRVFKYFSYSFTSYDFENFFEGFLAK